MCSHPIDIVINTPLQPLKSKTNTPVWPAIGSIVSIHVTVQPSVVCLAIVNAELLQTFLVINQRFIGFSGEFSGTPPEKRPYQGIMVLHNSFIRPYTIPAGGRWHCQGTLEFSLWFVWGSTSRNANLDCQPSPRNPNKIRPNFLEKILAKKKHSISCILYILYKYIYQFLYIYIYYSIWVYSHHLDYYVSKGSQPKDSWAILKQF